VTAPQEISRRRDGLEPDSDDRSPRGRGKDAVESSRRLPASPDFEGSGGLGVGSSRKAASRRADGPNRSVPRRLQASRRREIQGSWRALARQETSTRLRSACLPASEYQSTGSSRSRPRRVDVGNSRAPAGTARSRRPARSLFFLAQFEHRAGPKRSKRAVTPHRPLEPFPWSIPTRDPGVR
jgi:hypothetical protein